MTKLHVTTLRERHDLLPIVTEWLWREFWNAEGCSLQETRGIFAECVAETGAPQTFILFEGDVPVGTATLARTDLDEKPALSPWLAGVFVIPDRRGRGYVYHLIAAFEEACRAASVDVAWLYTNTAERIYLRAGWETVEIIQRPNKRPVTLMRRIIPNDP